jgi:UDP-glucose 4-epimerase
LDATAEVDPPAGTGPATLVLGGSGLLGSAVRRSLTAARIPVVMGRIPWTEPAAAVEALLEAVDALPDESWWLAWCAGSGVIATPPEEIEQELWVLREFLQRWHPQPGAPGSRAMFFASSAGGIYAGSTDPPFTESTDPNPLSPYGVAKVQAEAAFTEFAERTGIPLLIGRISTLFGPGQNLDKPQGLISQLCKAHVTGKPLSLYVSLDTMRDYLYADDAGAMVVGGLRAVSEAAAPGTYLKLFVSGRSVTVNEVVGEVRRVTRHRPPVVTQQSPFAHFHVPDLRMRSTAWPHLDGYAMTPLGPGIGACLQAVKTSVRTPQAAGEARAGR